MGVYINGMEMPKNCMVCPLHHYYFPPTTFTSDDLTVKAVSICMGTRRAINAEKCPLVEIQPHGRLVDADAFHKRFTDEICKDCERRKGIKNGKKRILYEIGDAPCRACFIDDAFDLVDAMPTVIEAENPQNTKKCGEKPEGEA